MSHWKNCHEFIKDKTLKEESNCEKKENRDHLFKLLLSIFSFTESDVNTSIENSMDCNWQAVEYTDCISAEG